jgi:16S rRNA (cytosine967-C5)-methyltransferase
MLAAHFAGNGHFLEFFSHNAFYRSPALRGIALLKNVGEEKPREIAAQVLGRRRKGGFVESLLNDALSWVQLNSADRRLCQELVFGVVRWQATLDWLIRRKTQNRAQKPALQDLLRLGLYQLFWLERIPSHAAVNETVEQAKRSGFGPQAGFINALLRGYVREFEPTQQLLEGLMHRQPHLGYSHPEWLAVRWENRWGKPAAAKLMDWNNTPPVLFARVNKLKVEPGNLLAQWRDEGVEYDFFGRDWLPENLVFELKSPTALERLPSFQQGLFYIQDPSTLLAVYELDPQPGQTVLDLCAAPGGKLSYIAQLMRNEGRILAHDVAPGRLKLLRENCTRLGLTNVQLLDQRSLVAAPLAASQGPDRTKRNAVETIPASFDRILVDAPCSNTGVMRRRVDLRWRIRPEEITRLRQVQLGLLQEASRLLQHGGRLVYSTCSLEPEENGQVVEEFLSNHPGLKLESERQVGPVNEGVDGAYVAVLKHVEAHTRQASQ